MLIQNHSQPKFRIKICDFILKFTSNSYSLLKKGIEMKKLVMVLPILALVFASIEISGDARVRPRVDVKDWGVYVNEDENSKTTDLYFLYRARLDLKADIGNGWFFNTKLGTNAPAYWTGKFGDGDTPHETSLSSSGRGSISFMELYYGYKGETAGVWGGVIPLAGHAGLDLHFYPEKVVDIPWLIYNNNATTGFAGYHKIFKRNLNWFVSIDNNVVNLEENTTSSDIPKNNDAVSIGIDYAYTYFGIDITSFLVKSFGSKDEASPITYGEHYSFPKFAGFSLGGTWAWTQNTVEKIKTVDDFNGADSLYYNSEPYEGNIFRFKLSKNIGPGSFLLWYDISNISWTGSSKSSNDDSFTLEQSGDFDYTYLWAHYKYVLHKSDFGEISIKPTVRIDTKNSANDDYSRTKFEITTEIKFK